MTKVGVIGAAGFVGSAISEQVKHRKELSIIPVVRGDDWQMKLKNINIIIYAANSGRRFFANNHPGEDYYSSVLQFAKLKTLFPNTKIVLISSISARTQLHTSYGRNRKTCELLTDLATDLVIRIGPMFGGAKKSGALYDILANKKVYQSKETQYAYVDVEYNARKIVESLGLTGIIESGAKQGISLEEIASQLSSTSIFDGENDTQIPIPSPTDAPDAHDVIEYALDLKRSTGLV